MVTPLRAALRIDDPDLRAALGAGLARAGLLQAGATPAVDILLTDGPPTPMEGTFQVHLAPPGAPLPPLLAAGADEVWPTRLGPWELDARLAALRTRVEEAWVHRTCDEILEEAAQLLAHPGTLDEAYGTLLTLIGNLGCWNLGLAWSLDARGELRCRGTIHDPEGRHRGLHEAFRHAAPSLQNPLMGRGFRAGRPLLLGDLRGLEDPFGRLPREHGMGSALYLPFRLGQECFGMLGFFSESPGQWAGPALSCWARLGPTLASHLRHRQALRAEAGPDATRRSLLDRLPVAVATYDAEGRVRTWNPAAQALFGWSAEEVVGGPPPFLPYQRRQEFFDTLHHAFQGGFAAERRACRLHRDGRPLDLRFWTAPLKGEDGRVEAMLGLLIEERPVGGASDLQPSLAFHQKGRRGPVRFEADPVPLLGPGTPEVLDPRRLHEWLHPHDLERLRRAVLRARQGQPALLDCRLRRADGTWRWIRCSLVATGATLKGVLQDAEAHHQQQESLLHTERLETFATLAGGLVQDFKNILTAILGYAEFLQEMEGLPPGAQKGLGVMERAARKGHDLVLKLLGLAREAEAQTGPHDLNHTLREVAELLPHALPPGVTMRLDLEEGLPLIEADPAQLHHVLLNLALNARDAVGAHGRITFRTGREGGGARPGAFMEVEDDGCGMPLEVQRRAFDPFYTTKPDGKGTGLGLAMVKAVAEQHGGRVALTTAPGAGCRLRVSFPPLGA